MGVDFHRDGGDREDGEVLPAFSGTRPVFGLFLKCRFFLLFLVPAQKRGGWWVPSGGGQIGGDGGGGVLT